MTGSLTVKGGKFYALLNIYEDGKRIKKWICTGLSEKGNKRKAEQFLREKIIEYERKEGLVYSDIRFSDYVRLWLDHISRTVDSVTMQGYRTNANSHVLPYFDNIGTPLSKIDHRILQRYIDAQYKNGRLDGKGGLSPRSLRQYKNIMSQALDMAVKENLILINPFQFVIMPPMERYESSYYNEQQVKELFQVLKNEPLLPIIKITALYGLRRSELLGLQWDSIDFIGKTMTIRHTVSKVTKAVAKDKTKNASSRRTFPLTDEALQIFLNAKRKEAQYRNAFGCEYQENTYIFKWPNGKPYSPDYISRRFKELLIKHNMPLIRFHELRHSCASMLIAMGWTLKDVQEWLGHSDIQTTANIYSHLDISRKVSIAADLGSRLHI